MDERIYFVWCINVAIWVTALATLGSLVLRILSLANAG